VYGKKGVRALFVSAVRAAADLAPSLSILILVLCGDAGVPCAASVPIATLDPGAHRRTAVCS
jgi:hypothetical protein